MRFIFAAFVSLAGAVSRSRPSEPNHQGSPSEVLLKFFEHEFWHTCFDEDALFELGPRFSADEKDSLIELSRLPAPSFYAIALAPTLRFVRDMTHSMGLRNVNQASQDETIREEVARLRTALLNVLRNEGGNRND